ncbi:MAG TPA: ATP-binding protein [bacterium]|nr:ATP-binding protein [bacterium]
MTRRLAEPAPGRLQLLTGPRQVGKTTLLLELARQYEPMAVYASCDGPEAALPGFWERLWAQATEIARAQRKAILLLDEVQHVPGWAGRLKAEWDRLRRHRTPIHTVATGSSALRVTSGSRESLAGRFERLTLSHWTAVALRDIFGIPAAEAPDLFVRFGCYPGAVGLLNDPPRWRAYVRDAIVEPAVGRDVLALGVIRRPALFRQVFVLCASVPAQIVSLQKLQGQLHDAGALETIAHYLSILEEAYLVAPIEKFSPRPLRRRAAPPKLVTLNNALLAAVDPHGAPEASADAEKYGRWVENACLAHAWNSGQRVSYWREEPLEVDGIIEGSWGAWAVEVKTRPFPMEALTGLLEFCRRHPRFRPLVLTGTEHHEAVRQAGVIVQPWTDFLLSGPPQEARD